MKTLKVLTSLTICILIIFTSTAVSFAADTESDSYKLLLEYGYEEDYLASLTDTMIEKMAETVKKASDPEYINDYDWLISADIPDAFIDTLSESSLRKLRTYLSDGKILALDYSKGNKTNNTDVTVKRLNVQLIDETDGSVKSEVVCAYWEWEMNAPLIREEDYISAKWNKDIFCYDSDSFYAEDYRRNKADSPWTVSDSYSTLASISLNSLGHWSKIFGTKKQVGGFMIFNLIPTAPLDPATNYDRDIDIEYTHETKNTLSIGMFILFILLTVVAVWVITEIRKRKRT